MSDEMEQRGSRKMLIEHCAKIIWTDGPVVSSEHLGRIFGHQLPKPSGRNGEPEVAAFERWGVLDEWEQVLDAAVRFTSKLALARLVEEKDKAVNELTRRVRLVEQMDAQVQAMGQLDG